MEESFKQHGDKQDTADSIPAGSRLRQFVRQNPWAVFVVPLTVYMLLANIEPRPPASQGEVVAGDDATSLNGGGQSDQNQTKDAPKWVWFEHTVDASFYSLTYTVRLMGTVAVMLLLAAGYCEFPWRISPLSIVVGVVGIVVWVGLCRLELEEKLLAPLGLGWFFGSEPRAAFNPFEALSGNLPWLIGFIVIRFIGLALLVPIIEEFFLRGFLVRFLANPDWTDVPFGQASRLAIIAPTLYGVLSHPAEAFAAAAWFSLVTWLMVKTRNIWDCVAAHAVTNLLLGIYVLRSGDWSLW